MTEFQRLFPGVNARLRSGPQGQMLSAENGDGWIHPWMCFPSFETKANGEGEWRVRVNPGFVNGRDAYIEMPEGWRKVLAGRAEGGPIDARKLEDVALTDDPVPYLVLRRFRNPLLSRGASVDALGRVVAQPGEAYPKFFETIGVKPRAAGGEITPASVSAVDTGEDGRNRELRAIDIFLSKPRIGTRVNYAVDNLLNPGVETIDPVFIDDLVKATNGRAKIAAMDKFKPDGADPVMPLLFTQLIQGQDTQLDEIWLATVWIVSPPGWNPPLEETVETAQPDGTWEPYVEHKLFWNLNHASRLVLPDPGVQRVPLTFVSALGFGLASFLATTALWLNNVLFGEVQALFNKADARGKFWTI